MRFFIGIAPDDAARLALWETAAILRGRIPARYVDDALYHLTVAFLGEHVPDTIDAIQSILRETAEGLRPFPLRLGALGAFGPILWRGVEASSDLDALAARTRQRLDRAGIAYDGTPFRPHITLARKARAQPDPRSMRLPGACFAVDRLILYESTRVQDKLAYLPRFEVYL